MATIVTPFCQITGGNVAQQSCLSLQTTHAPIKCFGCASPYRLCCQCRNHIVSFPEVDLCHKCLPAALQTEEVLDEQELAAPRPDRSLCTCNQRYVAYKVYERCLHCTVARYDPGLQPPNQENTNGSIPNADEDPLWMRAQKIVRQHPPTISLLRQELSLPFISAKKLYKRLHAAGLVPPPRQQNRGKTMSRKNFHSATTANNVPQVLYRQALAFVQGQTRITRQSLKDNVLGCTWSDIRKILYALEENDVIGPAVPGKGHEVLRRQASTNAIIPHHNGQSQSTEPTTLLAVVARQESSSQETLMVLGLHCLRERLTSLTQQVDELLEQKQPL